MGVRLGGGVGVNGSVEVLVGVDVADGRVMVSVGDGVLVAVAVDVLVAVLVGTVLVG